ncbi:MAG TPA: hypothetical protein VMW30_05705 [Candidatus Paceibacterota bacterium]|nr:hypothetical protein [Candidatus Paceibacterota bacterium]
MITVRVEIANDNGCWFVQDCDAVNLICWSDTEEDLRKRAAEAIIFSLEEQNIEPSEIAFNFSIVPLLESEMA